MIENIKFTDKRSLGLASARLFYTGATETFNTSNILAIQYSSDANGI
jgi:hypothetical protein